MGTRILILANSRKLSGRCVAGKDGNGTWIRLTKANNRPVPVREGRNYDIGGVIEVEGLTNRPSTEFNYHTENSVYTGSQVIGTLNRDLIQNYLDYPQDIWGTGRLVSADEVQQLNNSLLFVSVTNLCIYKKDCGQYGVKLRGQFYYNNRFYDDISVTDSSIEQRLNNVGYPYEENYAQAYITISLGEIFNGYSYKLISGVIIP